MSSLGKGSEKLLYNTPSLSSPVTMDWNSCVDKQKHVRFLNHCLGLNCPQSIRVCKNTMPDQEIILMGLAGVGRRRGEKMQTIVTE